MATTTATVGNEGQLFLPPEVSEQLHLIPGARITIIIEEPSIHPESTPSHPRKSLMGMFPGEPSLEDDYFRDKEPDSAPIRSALFRREAAAKAIQELRAAFAGQPSLEDEYFRTRDKDKW